MKHHFTASEQLALKTIGLLVATKNIPRSFIDFSEMISEPIKYGTWQDFWYDKRRTLNRQIIFKFPPFVEVTINLGGFEYIYEKDPNYSLWREWLLSNVHVNSNVGWWTTRQVNLDFDRESEIFSPGSFLHRLTIDPFVERIRPTNKK